MSGIQVASTSEFSDEYGDWLEGAKSEVQSGWLELTLGEMRHAVPLCVMPSVKVRDAIARMLEAKTSAVLVLERDALRGIFTERDVMTRVLSRADGLDRPIADFMTRDPHVLPENTVLAAAMRTLALGSYHHLPVVDQEGRPVALVSLQSIVAFLADAFPAEIMNAPPEHESFPPTTDGA
jgi:CBS domain-containing protein